MILLILAALVWWGLGIWALIREASKYDDLQLSEVTMFTCLGIIGPIIWLFMWIANSNRIIVKKRTQK